MLGRIKFYMRSHFYKIHNIWKKFNYSVRNIRYYSYLRFRKLKNRNIFYFVIDPQLKHPGLADRFKAIIGCYYIAKQNNYKFKIVYKSPFPLENYLSENQVKWIADFDELEYSIGSTRFLTYSGSMKFPKFKRGRQYHCYNYNGSNLLKNSCENYEKIWHDLYTILNL